MTASEAPLQRAMDAQAAAEAAQCAAEAAAYRERTRAALLRLARLAYGPLDQERTDYLVTYQHHELGHLRPTHPDSAAGAAICDWYASPTDDPGTELGPFRLARQAAAALLRQATQDPLTQAPSRAS